MLVNPYGKVSKPVNSSYFSTNSLQNSRYPKPYSLISYDSYPVKSSLRYSTIIDSQYKHSPYHDWSRSYLSQCQYGNRRQHHENPFYRSNLIHRDQMQEAAYSDYYPQNQPRKYRVSTKYQRGEYQNFRATDRIQNRYQIDRFDKKSTLQKQRSFERDEQLEMESRSQIFRKNKIKNLENQNFERKRFINQNVEEKVQKIYQHTDRRMSEQSFENKQTALNQQQSQRSPRFQAQESPTFNINKSQSPQYIQSRNRKYYFIPLKQI